MSFVVNVNPVIFPSFVIDALFVLIDNEVPEMLPPVIFPVDTFKEVDEAYNKAVQNGATSVLAPELEPWGQRTCYIADPEGNLIEIGSWNKPYESKDISEE